MIGDDEKTGDPETPARRSSAIQHPTQIGAYRVVGVLGEGGMAVVYLAEQSEPVRRLVALKIIKPGMDSNQVVARFESERQALAVLDHANIAKIFDGGITDAGRPYFVMERVKGVPITEYCDTRKLDTAHRLQLFVEVCSAVQHAHNKGLIHRDLKPTNILVGEEGGRAQPKIIDFGIAKATTARLTERTLYTRVGQIVGTPQYMSPEQADSSGLDVDTRSDIYSLGVVLYELLVGVVPMDLAALGDHAMRLALLEKDASKPSVRITQLGDTGLEIAKARNTSPEALRRQLRGDLDWVVMKAIAKDRAQRYETANALALDCERHLKHEPVRARPASAGYLLRRFVRRNRVLVTAVGLVFVALMVAVAGTSWGMIRAKHAEQRAEEEADIAKAVNEFLNEDLLAAVAPSMEKGRGKDVPMREVLDAAAQRIDEASRPGGRFVNAPRVEAAIRTTLGKTYGSLGEYAAAEPHLLRALQIYTQHDGEGAPDTAQARGNLGDLAMAMGQYDRAERYFQEALETWSESQGADNATAIDWMTAQGKVYGKQGRAADAEQLLQRALTAAKGRFGDDSPEALAPMVTLANFYQELGENGKAEALHLQAMKIEEQHYGPESMEMMRTMNNLANVYGSEGRSAEAIPLWTRALELKRRILGPEHPSTLNTLSNLAEVQEVLGDFARAEELHREVIDARTRMLGAQHPVTLRSKARLAFVMAKLGRLPEAESLASAVGASFRGTLGPNHPYTLETDDIMATILLAEGRASDAERILQRVRKTLEESQPEDTFSRTLVGAHLGLALAQLGKREEAEALWNEVVADLPPADAETTSILEAIVGFYEQWDAAQPDRGYGAQATAWRNRLSARPEH